MRERSSIDQVWQRLKEWAQAYADSDKDLPTEDECHEAARRLFAEFTAGADPEAVHFYGTEACVMIEEIRARRAAATEERSSPSA